MTYIKSISRLVAAAFILGATAAHADTVGETFAAMDVNADGGVTEAEFVAYATARGDSVEDASTKFAEIAGDDGFLVLEEMEAAYGTDDRASSQ